MMKREMVEKMSVGYFMVKRRKDWMNVVRCVWSEKMGDF